MRTYMLTCTGAALTMLIAMARVELRQRGDADYQELLDELRAIPDIPEAEIVEDGVT